MYAVIGMQVKNYIFNTLVVNELRKCEKSCKLRQEKTAERKRGNSQQWPRDQSD